MTLFRNYNFTASTNNLNVVVLLTCSHDCSPPFWQLFESSPPEVSRSGRDPSPQCELHVFAVFSRQKFSRPRNLWKSARGIGWIEQPVHLEVLQFFLSDFRTMRPLVVHREPYVTGENSGLHLLQLLAEESGVDLLQRSPSILSRRRSSTSFLSRVGSFATGSGS